MANPGTINLFHIFFVFPLLLLLGLDLYPANFKWLIVVIAFLVLIFHSYAYYKKMN